MLYRRVSEGVYAFVGQSEVLHSLLVKAAPFPINTIYTRYCYYDSNTRAYRRTDPRAFDTLLTLLAVPLPYQQYESRNTAFITRVLPQAGVW